MAEKTTASREKLRELLHKQEHLLAQFLLVTREQEKMIAAEADADSLLQSLEQRQQLISQMEGAMAELTPLWQEHTAKGPLDTALKDLHEEICRILQESTELDKINQLAVHERMDFIRGEIRRTSETRRGAEAYIKGAEVFFAEYVDERQ